MKALQPKGILSLFEPRAYLMTFTKSASKFQAFDSSHHPISAKRLCKGSGDTLPAKMKDTHLFFQYPVIFQYVNIHAWHQRTRNRLLGSNCFPFYHKWVPSGHCVLHIGSCRNLIPSPLCGAVWWNCPLEALAPFGQSWTRICRYTS